MRTSNTRTLHIERDDCQVIVTGLNQGYSMLDDALAHTLRLSATIVETGKAAGLDPLTGQRLYASLAQCAANMVRSRDDLVTAHQQAHKVRMRSSSADVVLWGCTGPLSQSEAEVAAQKGSAAAA